MGPGVRVLVRRRDVNLSGAGILQSPGGGEAIGVGTARFCHLARREWHRFGIVCWAAMGSKEPSGRGLRGGKEGRGGCAQAFVSVCGWTAHAGTHADLLARSVSIRQQATVLNVKPAKIARVVSAAGRRASVSRGGKKRNEKAARKRVAPLNAWLGHTNTDLCTWRFGQPQIFKYEDGTEGGWRPSEAEANLSGGKPQAREGARTNPQG